MTQPVQEPLDQRAISGLDYRVRQLARRPGAILQIAAVYHAKVVGDLSVVAVGDAPGAGNRLSFWAIEEDVAGMFLCDVEIDVTTVSSSGIVQVQLRNVDNGNVDMLSTRVQVDANETHSSTAATQPVVNIANSEVSHGDRIAIDIDAAGTGAKGLGLVAKFCVVSL